MLIVLNQTFWKLFVFGVSCFFCYLSCVSHHYFSDYSDVPQVFDRIKKVASAKIVDQVKAIYLFDVDRK